MDFPIRETIEKRHSVRTYEPRPLRAEDKEKLLRYRDGITNPFGIPVTIHMIETESSEQPKKLGTYGVIKGAGSFLGVVVPQALLGLEAAGYTMEELVLYAAHLGLGTCWLAATLNREAFTKEMQVRDDEWMPAISPVGYPAEKRSLPIRSQGSLQIQERNHRTDLWFSQRAAWLPVYTAIWKGADESKGCAYLCMPESQKVSKKAVEKPPYFFTILRFLGFLHLISQHLRRKPAFGLSQKRVCLRSETPSRTGGRLAIYRSLTAGAFAIFCILADQGVVSRGVSRVMHEFVLQTLSE